MQRFQLQTKFILSLFAFILLSSLAIAAQTTEFNYQGRINENNAPAVGSFDLEFRLYAAESGGAPLGVVQRPGVAVANGVFSVQLDFGASAFDGAERYLEITVRPAGSTAAPTVITPRQKLGAAPYAVRALSAATADNAQSVGGTPAAQIVATNDARLTDARPPLPNSGNYIQNRTAAAQTGANFSIDGTGTANLFNAGLGFNIGGSPFLRAPFSGTTTAVGLNAGLNSPRANNTYIGFEAGLNTTGSEVTFAGFRAGAANTTGFGNSFFGFRSGIANTTGSDNTFIGRTSGFSNTTGGNNAFIGSQAGFSNTTGRLNVFVGSGAASQNTEGIMNVALGTIAGTANTTGNRNTFLGYAAGTSNTTENDNTFLGYLANGAAGITNATAVGANAVVTQSNSLALGAGANVGIGTGAPQARLHIVTPALAANQWSLLLENSGLGEIRSGIRLSIGFLELTSRANLAAPNFARLDINGNWTAVSDARMKKNVAPAGGFLASLREIRPFSYNYLNEADDAPRQLGVMAQDVERFFPSLVTDGAVKTLNYAGLSVVAIGAIQEQQAEIDELREQNQRQQQQIDELKQLVCALKPEAKICR